MLFRVFFWVLVPAYAIHLASVSERVPLTIETVHVKLPRVLVHGSAPMSLAERAFERSVEDARQLGYPEVRVKMFTRVPPKAKRDASSLEEASTKTTWSWPWSNSQAEKPEQTTQSASSLVQAKASQTENPQQAEQSSGEAEFTKGGLADRLSQHDVIFAVPMAIQAPPVQHIEYVIVADEGKPHKSREPGSEESQGEVAKDLSQNPQAQTISQEEADQMMKHMMDIFNGHFGSSAADGLFSSADVFPGLGAGESMDWDHLGLNGGYQSKTTVCENGKCKTTTEYADPHAQGSSAPQQQVPPEQQIPTSWSNPFQPTKHQIEVIAVPKEEKPHQVEAMAQAPGTEVA